MPPTQPDLLRDRRQMIGYNEEEVEVVARTDEGDNDDADEEDDDEDDDQPFDCYDEEAALEAARRYSPWKDNTGKTVAHVASPSKSPKRSKSRPWRVDVMLRKGKGVERATSTWKQQMKERKQVFQWSGVTVVEDQSEDSVFHGIEDDEISKGDTSDRAVIGTFSSPSTNDLPEVIDCTEPDVIDCTEQLQEDPEQYEQTQNGSSAIYDFQNAMRALEQQLQQDSEYIGSGDDDDDDDMHSVYSVRSLASAVFPSAPEREEQRSLESTRRDIIQSLESTFTQGYDPYERYTITTTGRAGLDPPKQAKYEYHTVFQRFQRSRLAKELSMTVSLLPTKHFHVVEALTEADIARLYEERTTRTVPVVRSRYRVPTNELKPEPPVPAPAPTEAGVPTIFVPNQLEQSKQLLSSQDEGQVTTSTPTEEELAEPKTSDPSVVSAKSSISHDHDSSPQEGVSIESRDFTLTLPAESQHDTDATTAATPPTDDPLPGDVDEGHQHETQETPSIPLTTNVSEPRPTSHNVTDNQNDSSASQPSHSDSSLTVDATATATSQFTTDGIDVTISPSMAKKSKADKWKDRLAKRKSGIRRDSDVSSESTSVPPTTTKNDSPPPVPQIDPEQALPPSPLSADDTTSSKEKRKSMKWKQRLAEKKTSKSSPTAAQHKLLSDTGEAATPEPLTQIIEVPQTEDLSMEEAAEEAYKQLMGDLLTEDQQVTSSVPSQAVENLESTSHNDDQAQSQPTPSIVPTAELQEVPVTLANPSKPYSSSAGSKEPTIQPVVPLQTSKPVALPTDLRNSFMAFDALLRQRQGDFGTPDDDADEYSEYTIEEVSVVQTLVPTKTEPLSTEQREITPTKSADNESIYEEITVEQSYMELTVDDEQESGDEDSHESPKPASTPVHAATTNLMNSRMFSTPQVATEPTITVEHTSDDEMTVLTFDQSYAEPVNTGTASEPFSPIANDKLNDSARTSVKDTISGGGTGSMQGSRKRDSINGSHRSYGSRTSSTSDKSNKAISDVLRKDIWSKDVNVVEEALEAICMEASRGKKARAKISQFGGIMAIVRAMESHHDAEIVQVAGCNALERLALDPDTQVVIGEMGGITVILDAMKTFDGSGNVHQAACAALANITRHRGATDEVSDAVQVLCASMGRHATNMHVQAKAFGAIANICMDNKQRLRELSDAGGMLTMTMALQQPWPNKAEKHEAISNLSILLRCMAEHEESGHEEEYEGYPDEAADANDLMSVISALEDDLLHISTPHETNVLAKPTSPAKESSDVECLQKVPRTDRSKATIKALGLEQASNSTQPTEPTAREHDDENCTIS